MLTLYHNDMSLCAQKVRICLAEKGLAWEDKHLVLRAAEHQQPWYLKLNRRAVVPTLVHDGHVVTESNVILGYLDDVFPQPRLRPSDPYPRSKMRLWIKQLDEDVHDACAAILSFGIAFRHQYLERAELGKAMLERIPNIFKRERRRDVIENGTRSQHFMIAVQRMLQLLDEMEEALAEHRWLACEEYTLADVAFTPYLARLEHLNVSGQIAEISLARAPVNALSLSLLEQLIAALRRAAADENVRAVVLTSALPRRFSAGLDLRLMLGRPATDVRRLLDKLYVELADVQYNLGKPSIAAVGGSARGGGMTLAISCDVLLAGE